MAHETWIEDSYRGIGLKLPRLGCWGWRCFVRPSPSDAGGQELVDLDAVLRKKQRESLHGDWLTYSDDVSHEDAGHTNGSIPREIASTRGTTATRGSDYPGSTSAHTESDLTEAAT